MFSLLRNQRWRWRFTQFFRQNKVRQHTEGLGSQLKSQTGQDSSVIFNFEFLKWFQSFVFLLKFEVCFAFTIGRGKFVRSQIKRIGIQESVDYVGKVDFFIYFVLQIYVRISRVSFSKNLVKQERFCFWSWLVSWIRVIL